MLKWTWVSRNESFEGSLTTWKAVSYNTDGVREMKTKSLPAFYFQDDSAIAKNTYDRFFRNM